MLLYGTFTLGNISKYSLIPSNTSYPPPLLIEVYKRWTLLLLSDVKELLLVKSDFFKLEEMYEFWVVWDAVSDQRLNVLAPSNICGLLLNSKLLQHRLYRCKIRSSMCVCQGLQKKTSRSSSHLILNSQVHNWKICCVQFVSRLNELENVNI